LLEGKRSFEGPQGAEKKGEGQAAAAALVGGAEGVSVAGWAEMTVTK